MIKFLEDKNTEKSSRVLKSQGCVRPRLLISLTAARTTIMSPNCTFSPHEEKTARYLTLNSRSFSLRGPQLEATILEHIVAGPTGGIVR